MAEEEKTIAEDLVVTKYKMAGDIVNRKCPDVHLGVYFGVRLSVHSDFHATGLY